MRDELHATARRLVEEAKARGAKIDKKACRFNSIVDAAIRYGRVGGAFDRRVAEMGLIEAVECCIIGSPMHYEGGACDTLVPDWMLSCAEPGMADASPQNHKPRHF